MTRVVVLKLDGDLAVHGFTVSLEVKVPGARTLLEKRGFLPPAPDLVKNLQYHWQERYRNLGISNRIKPQAIVYQMPIQERVQQCKASAETLCTCFRNWLDSDSFRALDKRLREELNRNEDIQVLIRAEDYDLKKLPWHLWDFFERYPNAEPAFSPLESEPFHQPHHSSFKSSFKVLAILGDQTGIDITTDLQVIKNLPNVEATFLLTPTRKEVNQQLWDRAWDIIFFAGHGKTEGETGRIYINSQESLTLEELWYGLRTAVQKGLKLAIFNSCDGLGLARRLDDLQIPQMIVMRELVPDRVAQDFLKYFLREFSQSKSCYQAVRIARQRLHDDLEGEFPCASWLPVIFQNSIEFLPNPKLTLSSYNHLSQFFFLQKKAQRVIALLSLIFGLTGWKIGIPQLSKIIHNYGYDQMEAGNWDSALKALKLSYRLDQHRATGYFTGWFCEQVLDFDCAQEYYQKSAMQGSSFAYSNLARLSIIIDQDYAAAVHLSQRGLQFAEEDVVKYALYKNLGWARLKQHRYSEALEHLEQAVKIDINRADAYCLMAQVKQSENHDLAAQEDWESCLKFLQTDVPDHDVWKGLAQDYFKALKSQ
jgi:tetratricopeptide (TPR) repeat protein